MLWHGSKNIFTKFSLASAGQLTGASNGALGIWCAFEADHKFAASFAGDNGAIYGLHEPAGPVYDMSIGQLRDLHDAAYELGDAAEQAAFYDKLRLDLIRQGFGRIDIVELDERHSMCIVLDPEAVTIASREVRIIPYDQLTKVLGIDRGQIISDEEFSAYHSANRLRLMDALDRHICLMGVDDRSADGSKNYSTRVKELNQRRLPFQDALTRLTETHDQIWRDVWAKIDQDAEIDELDGAPIEDPEPVSEPEPAF